MRPPRKWRRPEGELAEGVREYSEGYEVRVTSYPEPNSGEDRLCVSALNEGGYCGTDIDLRDLIAWVKRVHPEWL